ncbi:hypothetical protein JOQ06_026058, partial [Pogonophryne albipinna]
DSAASPVTQRSQVTHLPLRGLSGDSEASQVTQRSLRATGDSEVSQVTQRSPAGEDNEVSCSSKPGSSSGLCTADGRSVTHSRVHAGKWKWISVNTVCPPRDMFHQRLVYCEKYMTPRQRTKQT